MTVKKLVADDPEVAAFRICNDQAIQALSPKLGQRRRELHVSDFTASDAEFCARKVLARWYRGKSNEFTSLVQRDGKFREQKWHEQFVAAGIVVSYQPEYRLGLLVGHPDWVLDWGYGPRVVDLTGQDRRNDFIAIARHTAIKKRQVRLYCVMSDLFPGYVLVEDKASSEYKMIAVARDQKEEEKLVLRVGEVSQVVRSLRADSTELDVVGAMRLMRRCGRKNCRWCRPLLATVDSLVQAEAAQDAAGRIQTDPDALQEQEGALGTERTAEELLELLGAAGEEAADEDEP